MWLLRCCISDGSVMLILTHNFKFNIRHHLVVVDGIVGGERILCCMSSRVSSNIWKVSEAEIIQQKLNCLNSLRAYDLKFSVLRGVVCKCCMINQIYYFCVTSDQCAPWRHCVCRECLKEHSSTKKHASIVETSCKLNHTVFWWKYGRD